MTDHRNASGTPGSAVPLAAAPWIERLARAGFAAKGIVYILVGALAVASAWGGGGGAQGSSGAMAQVADEAWGRALLALVAVGLAGYVVWRLVAAIVDPEDRSAGRRVFFVVTGLVYAGLAVEAASIALSGGGGGSGAGSDSATHWTARLMEQPFGRWLVVAAGVLVGGYGLYQLWRAWSADVGERLALGSLSRSARRWVVRIGRFGLGARGVVLCIVGAFFVVAGIEAQPQEARGLGGALATLREQPWGPWLMLVVAAGLVAYGVHNVVRARLRRIQPV